MPMGSVPISAPRIDGDAEARCRCSFGLARHAPPVDQAEARRRLAAEEDVLGHAELAQDAEFLMHHADAGIARVAGGAEMHVRPVDAHGAVIVRRARRR